MIEVPIPNRSQRSPQGKGRVVGDPILSLRGLCTSFTTHDGVVQAVQDVTLDVMRGECLGIVGESGSGKSVTFASVMGLIKPPGRITAGSVVFDGMELTRIDARAMRALRGKHMAMTMQDALTALNPSMTVQTQLCEVILAHDDEVAALPRHQRRRQARERAVAMMALVGIPSPETRLGEYPHQFSGGMRQRVLIAMALALGPELVLADEPTTSLDVIVQDEIFRALRRLQRERRFSMILVTHDIALVQRHCTQVAVMYAGEIVEQGPVDAVLRQGRHPYTMGLRNAVARLDSRVEPIAIPGQPPDAVVPLHGCAFAPRCPFALPRCSTEAPALTPATPGHLVACHRADAYAELEPLARDPATWDRMPSSPSN